MTANINVVEGKYAIFLGNNAAAWHKLVNPIEGMLDRYEAQIASGTNYEVEKRQLSYVGDNLLGEPINYLVDAFGVFRTDTNQFLGTVGKDYGIVQNSRAFELIDALLDASDSKAFYDSAGALGKGEKIFVSAKIPLDFSVGNDKHKVYIGCIMSHDGSMRITLKLLVQRMVCENTVTVALNENGLTYTFSHRKNVNNRIDAAKKVLTSAANATKDLSEKFNQLAHRKITKVQIDALNEKILPKNTEAKTDTRRENVLDEILARYEFNDGDTFPEQRGTAFNYLNAWTGYTDHEKTVRKTEQRKAQSEDSLRAQSSILGAGDAFKQKVLDVIYLDTKGNEIIVPTVYSLPSTPSGSLLDDVLQNGVRS